MADKDKTTNKKKAAVEGDEAEGAVTGKAAPPAAPPPAAPKAKLAKNIKKEKLPAKNKSRLPRKRKKAEKKAAAARP
jgi:hypothetical protein